MCIFLIQTKHREILCVLFMHLFDGYVVVEQSVLRMSKLQYAEKRSIRKVAQRLNMCIQDRDLLVYVFCRTKIRNAHPSLRFVF